MTNRPSSQIARIKRLEKKTQPAPAHRIERLPVVVCDDAGAPLPEYTELAEKYRRLGIMPKVYIGLGEDEDGADDREPTYEIDKGLLSDFLLIDERELLDPPHAPVAHFRDGNAWPLSRVNYRSDARSIAAHVEQKKTTFDDAERMQLWTSESN